MNTFLKDAETIKCAVMSAILLDRNMQMCEFKRTLDTGWWRQCLLMTLEGLKEHAASFADFRLYDNRRQAATTALSRVTARSSEPTMRPVNNNTARDLQQ